MSRLYFILIFLFLLTPNYGQRNICNKMDTNSCFIMEKYPIVKIEIELKIESEDGVSLSRTSLLADIDGDCIPELIIGGIENNQLNFINPFNGKTIKKINSDYFGESASPFAIADVDNDGKIEIVLSMYDGIFTSPSVKGKLVCLNLDGTTKWISDQKYGQNISFSKSGCPAFADFNQDGKTEVYIHNSIFNGQTGAMLCNGGLNGIGNQTGVDPTGIGSSSEGTLSVAAQLDDDPADLELAAGYSVYKVMISNPSSQLGNKMTPLNILIDSEYRDGLTSVADINQDGKLDVIVSSAQKNIGTLYVYSIINGLPTLLTKKSYSNNISNIGPALIGDINGTGQLSIIIDRPDSLFSFNYDGTTMLNQQWSTKVNDKSGDSHLTLFDLDNDGKNEIIYRDESFLRILNSASNFSNELAKIKCPAPSRHEGPIVGDIDNSGNVKICVSCFNIDSTLMKLYIFAPPDTLPGWAPGRGIWNQYAYNPIFINDDLTVPQFQKNQATYKNGKYNNFMQQESYVDSNGMVRKAAASLTGQIKCINYDPITNEYIVVFDLYNRKDASNLADSNLAVSFYNGDPTSSGTLIGIYYTLKTILAGDSLLNLEYRFSASNLKDLFMVVNTIRNGSGVFDDKDFTQAECDYTDNISRTLELPKLYSIQAKICKGASFHFLDTTLQDPGMYYRKLSTINGCDSLIYILNLSTVDTIYIKQSVAACDVYSWNNKLITQSGIYVFDTLNQFGCDSIISLDLIINKSSVNKTQHTACDSYTWNGQTYDKSGFYTFQTMNQAGCDSTLNLELIIHKSDTTNLIIETCDSYVWNGRTYTQSGIYTLDTMNQNGCDSSLTLDLSINSIIQISTSQSSCDSLTWNGITYTQSGIYKDTTQSSKGCDSITTLQLIISKSNQSLTTQTSCNSYSWNGTTYTKSGTYTFATQNAAGCDSIATLQLIVNPSTNSTTNINTCDSLIWNNIIYKQSGTYQYTTLNGSGCDSIATLKLIIHPSNHIRIQQTACNSYTWNGKTYNQSGSYLYQTINSTGCDSITTLDLNIIPSSTKDTSITICDSITFLNKTLSTKGNYTFTLQNTQGCDSVINLNLNINSQHYRSNVSTCGSYQWNVNGNSYDSSGIYIAKYTNRSACDSIYQLDLTINKNYEIKEKAEVCKEYLWPVNKVVYTQSGDYIYPLKTNHGCDSIIKLNLLVNPEFQHADTVTTTDAYTWPVNQKTYPTSGTYKEIYQTQNGCDSIHLLLLSINKDVSIYYPNIIHPGGLNSFFTIYVYGASATIKYLSIYDRWGERIWQKQNFPPNELQHGWDGKYKDQDVMPGVYVWHAEIVLKDGSVIMEKGDVSVVH